MNLEILLSMHFDPLIVELVTDNQSYRKIIATLGEKEVTELKGQDLKDLLFYVYNLKSGREPERILNET